MDRLFKIPSSVLWLFFALLTLFLYLPGLNGPFLLDDITSVQPAVLDHWSWEGFIGTMLNNTSGPLGRPLAVATFILNHHFFGDLPFSYKLTNVCLHLGIGFLIFIFLKKIAEHLNDPRAVLLALLTSTVWLVHPIQVSTALYPVQRMAQLSDLFMLLGCLGYVSGRLRQIHHKPHATVYLYTSAALCFPLALLSKESGILLSLYYLCLELFIFKGVFYKEKDKKNTWVFLGLCAILPIIATVGYLVIQWDIYLGRYNTHLFGLTERLLSEPVVLWFYLKELVIPKLSELGLFLDDFPIYSQLDLTVIAALLGHAALITVMWLARRSVPLLSFGLAWFYASHALESTALPLELAFEHRNYLASLGIFLIMTQGFLWATQRLSVKPLIKNSFIGVWIILLAYLTQLRVMGWENLGVFLSVSLDEHPKSARAHVFWSNYLLENGLREKAFEELKIAHQLSPSNSGVIFHQLLFYCDNRIPTEFKNQVFESAKDGIITAYSLSALDTLIMRALHGGCPAVSKETLLKIFIDATQNPNIQYQHSWLASLYQYRAYAHFLSNQYQPGIEALDKSFELYPNRITPLLNKAEYQIIHRRWKDATDTLAHIRILLADRPFAHARYVHFLETKLETEKARNRSK